MVRPKTQRTFSWGDPGNKVLILDTRASFTGSVICKMSKRVYLHQGAVEVCELLFCSYFMKTSFIILPLFIISFAKHECKLILNDCIVGFVNEKHRNMYMFMYSLN